MEETDKHLLILLKDWVSEVSKNTSTEALESFYGHNWWQITAEEMHVFDLSLDDANRIFPVYLIYEAIATETENDFAAEQPQLYKKAKQSFKWISRGIINDIEFRKLSKHFGISNQKAYCYFQLHEMKLVREGIIQFEKPS